jgi:hypothetical protein
MRAHIEPGTRHGRVVVTGQAAATRTDSGAVIGRYTVRCDCGTEFTVTTANLRRTLSCGCARRQPRPLARTTDTYSSIHQRLRRERGPASRHPCHDCGGPAAEWSYLGDCPDEQRDTNGLAFCTHPEHYAARDVVHHRRADAAHRRMLTADIDQIAASIHANITAHRTP